jgi:predicted house-cleaning noncanonical NTP pyrophosphatase (MazG superfamily)
VFQSDPNTSDIDFATIKEMSKKIGPKDPFSAKINELKNENAWIEQIVSFSANKPANEWNDKDFHEAVLKIEEMVRHFITSYRLYTLREKHSDTKIIDIAIFEGQRPERSSKFYKFKTDSSSVEKVTEDVMKFLEDKKLTESEKGEVVLKVLKKIMNFGDSSKGKMKA